MRLKAWAVMALSKVSGFHCAAWDAAILGIPAAMIPFPKWPNKLPDKWITKDLSFS